MRALLHKVSQKLVKKPSFESFEGTKLPIFASKLRKKGVKLGKVTSKSYDQDSQLGFLTILSQFFVGRALATPIRRRSCPNDPRSKKTIPPSSASL